ncbi:MAG: trehalose-6-phosphate synthase [Polyangia bacterium]
MPRSMRFLLLLLGGLALLSITATWIAQRTMRRWFITDLTLRAQLAYSGVRPALIERWDEPGPLHGLLTELSQDERLMAAAACDTRGRLIAMTDGYPAQLGCTPAGRTRELSHSGSGVHVNTFTLVSGDRPLGAVHFLHNLAHVDARIGAARRFMLLCFAVLAGLASLFTVLLARLTWREWIEELQKVLRGRSQRADFMPLLHEVRELVERISQERSIEAQAGSWTPQRLKLTLQRHLEGERVVLLANREPYIHERGKDGELRVQHPASGLVTALEPVMRACSGVWVGHGSGSADRECVDRRDHVRVPPGEESYVLRRVWLSPEEEKGYYYGFSNEGLWPLCHIAHTRPQFRAEDFEHYRRVNQKFADAVCSEVDHDDPIILVQDYHFALAPRMIRKRLPRATILTFWHIPWPNAERFGICPFRKELLEGLLGSSILGFHTPLYCNNFIDSIDRFLEARIDRAQQSVIQSGRSTLVRAYPISVEWPVRWLADLPPVATCRQQVLREHGLPADALIGVGVDRIDYTKGIEERLLAVERLLERAPELRGRFVFIQLGAPSRTGIEQYRLLNESVAALAQRINARFGSGAYQPVLFARAHHEPPVVFRYLRAADLCYVSSLHDGMNLVAKEFIAARDDERGVLVLSHFTGAATELHEALIVNPYDLEEASAALLLALRMPVEEQRTRVRAMRALVAEFNVYRWAGRMLVDAATARKKSQLRFALPSRLRVVREAS